MVRKSAFTLIELLFAIIIIAISVISLPMMNQAIEKGISSNILQEAIFAAVTELNEATTAHWDDNSFDANATNTLAKVIDIPTNAIRCDNNSSSNRYRLMPGHISQPLHRRCLNNNSTTLATTDVTTVTSLDDMNDTTSKNIFTDLTTNAQGYKQNYKSQISVVHSADFNGSSDNIKEISVTVTSSTGEILTKLHTFSMNVGEVDYLKKEY